MEALKGSAGSIGKSAESPQLGGTLIPPLAARIPNPGFRIPVLGVAATRRRTVLSNRMQNVEP